MLFQPLVEFRQTLYRLIGRSKDVLFDLMDAVLTTPDASSFVRFSQNPLFRREWSSLYSGLKRARLPHGKLAKCLTQQVPTDQRPVLSGDTTRWSRPNAETLKERSYGRNTSGSIEVGHTYSTLAWVPESEGSWAHRRSLQSYLKAKRP
ncbi:MAG: transposase [Cyanothece sp. SIO2G6]|nr:transposase [Cyanothece sp. SIO2G6]